MAVPSPVPKSAWDCVRDDSRRRRVFWTTQPDACGEYIICGHVCSIPGLVYVPGEEPAPAPVPTMIEVGDG
jgi:hypothetical protein